jgi:hypothetical protein
LQLTPGSMLKSREWAEMLSVPLKSSADQNTKALIRRKSRNISSSTDAIPREPRPNIIHRSSLAECLVTGMPFYSPPTIRLADTKAVQLGHTLEAGGRWRLFAFSSVENPAAPSSGIRALRPLPLPGKGCYGLRDYPTSYCRRTEVTAGRYPAHCVAD